MHLFQHPPPAAMRRFIIYYVSERVSQNAPWLRNHTGEGWGHEAGTRACSMTLRHTYAHTHMRTNTKRQSNVVVTHLGALNCPLLSVTPSALSTPNPAPSTPLIHAPAFCTTHTHTHAHTPHIHCWQQNTYTYTCMSSTANLNAYSSSDANLSNRVTEDHEINLWFWWEHGGICIKKELDQNSRVDLGLVAWFEVIRLVVALLNRLHFINLCASWTLVILILKSRSSILPSSNRKPFKSVLKFHWIP